MRWFDPWLRFVVLLGALSLLMPTRVVASDGVADLLVYQHQDATGVTLSTQRIWVRPEALRLDTEDPAAGFTLIDRLRDQTLQVIPGQTTQRQPLRRAASDALPPGVRVTPLDGLERVEFGGRRAQGYRLWVDDLACQDWFAVEGLMPLALGLLADYHPQGVAPQGERVLPGCAKALSEASRALYSEGLPVLIRHGDGTQTRLVRMQQGVAVPADGFEAPP